MYGILAAGYADWPIIHQISWLLGKVMNGIYNVMDGVFGVQNIGAVSYTHLDVYKRQVFLFSYFSLQKSAFSSGAHRLRPLPGLQSLAYATALKFTGRIR